MFEEVKGCLFEVARRNDVPLMHQCNCVSPSVSGLAAEVYRRFPRADFRGSLSKPELYGMVHVYREDGVPLVINSFSQLYPGKPFPPNDSAEYRIEALEDILEKLTAKGIHSIAVPCRFGSDLAGGKWSTYRNIFHRWSQVGNNRVIIAERVV